MELYTLLVELRAFYQLVRLNILIVLSLQNELPLLTITKIVAILETRVLNFDKKKYFLIQYR